MTAVYRDLQTKEVLVFTKGADSVIFPLCRNGQDAVRLATQKYLDEYARDGLRTLILAKKTMSDSQYTNWANNHRKASLSVSNRDGQIEQVAALIENDFEISGSTAIEDRLQEGVPDSIKHIRAAGIKLWILTGDKIETAINIGYSCGLLDDNLN